MKVVALIPGRAGSKRIPGKNIRPFFGHPLIAYAIDAARKSGIFSEVFVSSDSEEIGRIGEHYGATFIARPAEIATDISPDSAWINHALFYFSCDAFMILRPTNPFRTKETILEAWDTWDKDHCMKAIQRVKEHPGKMWNVLDLTMVAYWRDNSHLQPYQCLPPMFIQNASLEIRLASKADGTHWSYQPFFTEGYEGFDLNTELDWIIANVLVERQMVPWPKIERTPYEPSL